MSGEKPSSISDEWEDADFDLANGSQSDNERSHNGDDRRIEETGSNQGSQGSEASSGIGSFVDATAPDEISSSQNDHDSTSSGVGSFVDAATPDELSSSQNDNGSTGSGVGSFVDAATTDEMSSSQNDNGSTGSGVGSFVDTSTPGETSSSRDDNSSTSIGVGSFVDAATTDEMSSSQNENDSTGSGVGSFVDASTPDEMNSSQNDNGSTSSISFVHTPNTGENNSENFSESTYSSGMGSFVDTPKSGMRKGDDISEGSSILLIEPPDISDKKGNSEDVSDTKIKHNTVSVANEKSDDNMSGSSGLGSFIDASKDLMDSSGTLGIDNITDLLENMEANIAKAAITDNTPVSGDYEDATDGKSERSVKSANEGEKEEETDVHKEKDPPNQEYTHMAIQNDDHRKEDTDLSLQKQDDPEQMEEDTFVQNITVEEHIDEVPKEEVELQKEKDKVQSDEVIQQEKTTTEQEQTISEDEETAEETAMQYEQVVIQQDDVNTIQEEVTLQDSTVTREIEEQSEEETVSVQEEIAPQDVTTAEESYLRYEEVVQEEKIHRETENKEEDAATAKETDLNYEEEVVQEEKIYRETENKEEEIIEPVSETRREENTIREEKVIQEDDDKKNQEETALQEETPIETYQEQGDVVKFKPDEVGHPTSQVQPDANVPIQEEIIEPVVTPDQQRKKVGDYHDATQATLGMQNNGDLEVKNTKLPVMNNIGLSITGECIKEQTPVVAKPEASETVMPVSNVGGGNGDEYYVDGCMSNVSRSSNVSQFTHFTTESASTYLHKNTAGSTLVGDDFSMISEKSLAKEGQPSNSVVQTGGLPLMTTLETDEYRKERDRLEMRKIALVEMSNAYKTSSESLVEGESTPPNITPKTSPTTAQFIAPPPPPPPQPIATREIAPTMSTPLTHNGEVELKSLNNDGNGRGRETMEYRMMLDKSYDPTRLIKVGVLLLILGCLGSIYAENTCHFVSIKHYIGYYSEPFHLHAGMYEYTSMDSAFSGHAFCLPYDDYYSAPEPTIPRQGGAAAIIAGVSASIILWFYLITLRMNSFFWKAGIALASVAAVCQASTFYFFFDQVCAEEMCGIGPGSFMSFLAVLAYAGTAREMYQNSPIATPRLVKIYDREDDSSYTAPEMV